MSRALNLFGSGSLASARKSHALNLFGSGSAALVPMKLSGNPPLSAVCSLIASASYGAGDEASFIAEDLEAVEGAFVGCLVAGAFVCCFVFGVFDFLAGSCVVEGR